MLEISGLSIRYGAVEVVHGVSMRIEEGQIVALIGPNGAGKSSVLRAVSGIKRPSGGNITLMGASIVGALPHKIVAAGIAHVMEGRHLFSGLNVEDNLLLAASSGEGDNGGSLEEVYRRWPILKERTKQLAGNMSGGEQQMLAIARALMTRPRLVILDEPSWGLAPRVVHELMHTITQLRSEGITIFLCEQMANLALKICDYGYVMSNGHVVMEGRAEELLSNPDLQATYLGGAVGEAGAGGRGKKEELTRNTKDIAKMKETLDMTNKVELSEYPHTEKDLGTPGKQHQKESQAYNKLFDPILSRTASPEQEKDGKAIEGLREGKQRQNKKEGPVSLPTDNQQTHRADYKSREIARQKKQAKWQEQNKI